MSENLNESSESPQHDADESEPTTTLDEVLEMQEEMIEDVAAVLGGSNEKSCSYSEGYLKRQALYSCLTCIPEARDDPTKGAGICLACSYHCHDGHELVELYTKRNFRCDCGNSKFNEVQVKCSFVSDKDELNELNEYNQNFSGLYCICHKPYPDPEDPLPDEMIQCIVCEDWYHSRHLGVEITSPAFVEMICSSCVEKHEFLLHYDTDKVKSDESEMVDVTTTAETGEEKKAEDKPEEKAEDSSEEKADDQSDEKADGKPEEKADEKSEEKSEEKPKERHAECKKPLTKSDKITAKFWLDLSWRQQLCTCPDCMEMYESEKVMFLLDAEDPVHLYEEKGKTRIKEAREAEDRNLMTQLNSLDRVQLVEAIAGYNDLKKNLAEYLKKFAENKKTVREEDIREFFDGMMARKKQKASNGIPHFCR